jgi:hypothetical protein
MENVLNLDRSQRLDIICRKGDTFTLNLELKDQETGNAVVLTDTDNKYTFTMDVRVSDTSSVNIVDISSLVSVDSPGLVTFSVSAEDMADLTSGLYVYDVQQTRTDTTPQTPEVLSVETLIYGTFKINEDVTTSG